MESSLRETSGVKREIDFTLSPDDLKPYYDRAYRRAQERVQMKGFRKGKTPLNIIKKLYGDQLEGEVIESVVQEEFNKQMRDREARPIGTPSITKLDRNAEGGLDITIAYEVLPHFELSSYKGLTARRYVHAVSDDEIEHELDHLRERFMGSEPAEIVANDQHIVTIDLQKLDESGAAIEGEVSRDVKVYLARHGVNTELKSLLLNTKVGDTFRIELPTGENEAMTPYEVTVREINQAVLPDVDDAFAEQVVGEPGTTAEQLREMIRGSIESNYSQQYQRMFRDELINQLVENHRIDVPDALVTEALNHFVEDMKQGQKRELPPNFDRDQFDAEMRPMAERTVRWALIRDRIIESEGLKPEESDYEGLADMEAQRTGIEYEKLLQYFRNAPQVADRILAEKAMQLLEDYAIIEEVDDTELRGSHGHDHDHDHEHGHHHDHAH
jgi:trigger factor